MSKTKQSKTEQTIAKEALNIAYEREISALIASVRDRASSITELNDLWYLHDLLSTKRYEIDGKYEYNSSTILFDFAQLVQEGWLHLDELKELKPEMQSKISALARM
ncbi:MAG: hypothetical protein ACFCU7_02645 [Pleurocapsa sp.]